MVDWLEIQRKVLHMMSSPEHLVLDVSLLQWSPPVACDSSGAESDSDMVNELTIKSNEVSLFTFVVL